MDSGLDFSLSKERERTHLALTGFPGHKINARMDDL